MDDGTDLDATADTSVAIDGRLEWREWEAHDGSGKRQAVSIVAERVQLLETGNAAERVARPLRAGQRRAGRRSGLRAGCGGGSTGDDDLPF